MSTIKTENGLRIQTSDAGKMLTNGETYSKTVYLPDDAVNWAEIPESEMPIVEEEIEAINKTKEDEYNYEFKLVTQKDKFWVRTTIYSIENMTLEEIEKEIEDIWKKCKFNYYQLKNPKN